jgi:hypothetical protein
MRYIKKPVIIEAIQWFKDGDHSEVKKYPVKGCVPSCRICEIGMTMHGFINTLEGGHIVCPGDWIIKGVKNEYYPCKPDIFELTYEPVESEG